MLYSEIIAVCSQIHTKHINTLCGQDVELGFNDLRNTQSEVPATEDAEQCAPGLRTYPRATSILWINQSLMPFWMEFRFVRVIYK